MFFGEINYIFLYAILPILITVFILSRKKVNKALSIFIKNFNFKKDKNYKRISNLRISSIIFLILAIGFLIFALMQPKWGIIEKKIKTESYMITILLDLSKSMDANDIYPSRLGRAKLEIEDFIKSVDNLSVALVGFAGTSFIATPFTQDMETFTHILDNLSPKSVALQGTRIADALQTAKNTFNINSISQKSIILITDGEDHVGNFETTLKELKDMNISVYTVGIGTEEGESIVSDLGVSGRTIISKRDDETLKLIADYTGGKSYINTSLKEVFNDIKNNSDSFTSIRNSKSYEERFQIFIFISIILLTISIILNLFTQIRIKANNYD
ncbi:VWA domain-containing protein [Brachyspira aalborgi]|uniref:VWA domain-containing protein n=1 Tax=Brachyspira aalborgi TaxID=29522 RepID=A0A5C8EGA9_9SPIR|nr:VWA domain-containing protein [Brachyspira aalborgi]TXJ35692.1 VWA domain-containing protein [Brachyspira aalborgi]TXJ50182.1 VWA domain-containing protein [Brachyspira aalborgi]